jgi:hypothetical protein
MLAGFGRITALNVAAYCSAVNSIPPGQLACEQNALGLLDHLHRVRLGHAERRRSSQRRVHYRTPGGHSPASSAVVGFPHLPRMTIRYRRVSLVGLIAGHPMPDPGMDLEGRSSGPRCVRGPRSAGRVRLGASCGGHEQGPPGRYRLGPRARLAPRVWVTGREPGTRKPRLVRQPQVKRSSWWSDSPVPIPGAKAKQRALVSLRLREQAMTRHLGQISAARSGWPSGAPCLPQDIHRAGDHKNSDN